MWAACFRYGEYPVPFMTSASMPGIHALNALGNERKRREQTPDVSLGLFSCLVEFGSSESSLPQDLFYAFLGLGKHSGNPRLRPDYSSSWDTIVRRVSKELLFLEEGMEILMQGGLRDSESSFPSWIPDYRRLGSRGKVLGTKRPYSASGDSKFIVTSVPREMDAVVVYGIRVDNVINVTTKSNKSDWYNLPSEDILQFVTNCLATFSNNSENYPTNEHPLDVCWRTIIADRSMKSLRADNRMAIGFYGFHIYLLKHANGEPGLERWEDLIQLVAKKFNIGFVDDFDMMKEFREWTRIVSCRYELLPACTQRGYVGLVPQATKSKDQVWVVSGCELPLVLRESLARPGYFRLVGACYMHGVMDGEAFNAEELHGVFIH